MRKQYSSCFVNVYKSIVSKRVTKVVALSIFLYSLKVICEVATI